MENNQIDEPTKQVEEIVIKSRANNKSPENNKIKVENNKVRVESTKYNYYISQYEKYGKKSKCQKVGNSPP